MRSIDVIGMDEIKLLLKEAGKVSKALKISREEALLLIIAHELGCLHDHVDKVIFGIFKAHAKKEGEKP